MNNFTNIYVTKTDYLDELCRELGDSTVMGNLVLSSHQKHDVCFALDVWLNPTLLTFESISQAVHCLREKGKYWFLNPVENVRRSRLIEAELRKLPSLEQNFPIKESLPAIGCFSLLDKNTLVYSTERWKKPPLGDFRFIEDKYNPPNRAYLKLWEALSLLERLPCAGENAIDLGASPGGWTYVMQSLGARVTAIDKALLEPRITALPGVQFLKQSAFAFDPESLAQPIDWLLCDVACYPERLYPLVIKWIQSKKAKQMIFTVKLQGETNLAIIQQFQAIPGSRVIHLNQNKHEATFFYPAPASLFPCFKP